MEGEHRHSAGLQLKNSLGHGLASQHKENWADTRTTNPITHPSSHANTRNIFGEIRILAWHKSKSAREIDKAFLLLAMTQTRMSQKKSFRQPFL